MVLQPSLWHTDTPALPMRDNCIIMRTSLRGCVWVWMLRKQRAGEVCKWGVICQHFDYNENSSKNCVTMIQISCLAPVSWNTWTLFDCKTHVASLERSWLKWHVTLSIFLATETHFKMFDCWNCASWTWDPVQVSRSAVRRVKAWEPMATAVMRRFALASQRFGEHRAWETVDWPLVLRSGATRLG